MLDQRVIDAGRSPTMKNLWSFTAWSGCLLIVLAIVHGTRAIDIEVSSERMFRSFFDSFDLIVLVQYSNKQDC